jgi:hypothetical protein
MTNEYLLLICHLLHQILYKQHTASYFFLNIIFLIKILFINKCTLYYTYKMLKF